MIREKSFQGNEPLLYLVATPIGNLQEWSPRAIEIIKEMDFIAAEDTRNSGLLLSHFGIKKPFISCHEHNEASASDKIIALLKEGKKVAYLSDAGYPIVSDPGSKLAKRCREEGIKLSVVNGPNAAIHALVGSGLSSEHFYFHGFLPSKPTERKKELESLKEYPFTIIFYESPHRIIETLKDISSILGEDRPACIGRELSKAHEEFIRGSLGELTTLDPESLIGEMVIVVEGKEKKEETIDDEKLIQLLQEHLKTSPSKTAIKEVAELTGVPKNRIYDLYLEKVK